MCESFTSTTIGKTGLKAFRLGLSAVYRPGKEAIRQAIDGGINFILFYNFDNQMIRGLKDIIKYDRDNYVLATGAFDFKLWEPNLIRVVERRLRQLGTDYLDILYFFGISNEPDLNDSILRQFEQLKQSGKIRCSGISTHNRKLAGELVDRGVLDIFMVRYNAAHRGAETEIFPFTEKYDPGIVSYTATRWRQLAKKPKKWPEDEPLPSAGMAYRFVLSNPHVHICLTAPSNARQLEENLNAVKAGALDDSEMALMREFGDFVYNSNRKRGKFD